MIWYIYIYGSRQGGARLCVCVYPYVHSYIYIYIWYIYMIWYIYIWLSPRWSQIVCVCVYPYVHSSPCAGSVSYLDVTKVYELMILAKVDPDVFFFFVFTATLTTYCTFFSLCRLRLLIRRDQGLRPNGPSKGRARRFVCVCVYYTTNEPLTP